MITKLPTRGAMIVTTCNPDDSPTAASDQAPFHRPDSRRRTIGHIELAQDVLHVFLDGFDADFQRESDLTVAQSVGQVNEHLILTSRQRHFVRLRVGSDLKLGLDLAEGRISGRSFPSDGTPDRGSKRFAPGHL